MKPAHNTTNDGESRRQPPRRPPPDSLRSLLSNGENTSAHAALTFFSSYPGSSSLGGEPYRMVGRPLKDILQEALDIIDQDLLGMDDEESDGENGTGTHASQ